MPCVCALCDHPCLAASNTFLSSTHALREELKEKQRRRQRKEGDGSSSEEDASAAPVGGNPFAKGNAVEKVPPSAASLLHHIPPPRHFPLVQVGVLVSNLYAASAGTVEGAAPSFKKRNVRHTAPPLHSLRSLCARSARMSCASQMSPCSQQRAKNVCDSHRKGMKRAAALQPVNV